MRIALATETYPPEVNGVAMTLSRLVAGLAARGHHVEVVRPRQAEELGPGSSPARPPAGVEQCLVRGVPIPFYRTLRIGVPTAWSLRRHWGANRPDVVHVATEGPLGLSASFAAGRLGIPVSSSYHTHFHQYGGHYGFPFVHSLAWRYLRWFHNRTACTLVPTDQMCGEMAAGGFERLGVLARGVDARLFTPMRRSAELRERWGAEPTDPVALYVGRIAPEKNLDLAVRAFLAMRAGCPRLRFVLVGDGPLRAELVRRYPDFNYAGVLRGEELAAHYASADVFLFPSTTETFGNVITEAMASGLVVLSYDYAAARQHVRSGDNGFAAVFDQADAFIELACEVMRRRPEWGRVRAAARATAETISWDSVVGDFEQTLAGVTAAEGGGWKERGGRSQESGVRSEE